MSTTPHLGLPLLAAAQAQKHVTHNEALFALDALVQCAVLDRDLSAPPLGPAEGDRHIVGPAPTGDWAGKEDFIVLRQDGAWLALPPQIGFVAYIADEALLCVFTGGGWIPLADTLAVIQNLARLGIGTAADAANPFAAKLNGALWTARGTGEGGTGDLRYTLNKESAGKVLSLLFQTNYSGRFELGLIGDDRPVAKVSPDGTTWRQVLSVDPASGSLDFLSAETSVASAATVDLGTQPTRRVVVTGTTAITSLGTGTNCERLVRFAGALTLTHNATSLILPGGSNITTASGDVALFASDASGNWRVAAYQRASGFSLGAGVADAVQHGSLGLGVAPGPQLTVRGANETATAPTGTGTAPAALGAALYLQDTGGAPNNGGAVLFGATQGVFAAIKGALQSGTGPAGHIVLSTRLNVGGSALTPRLLVRYDGLVTPGADNAQSFGTAATRWSDVRTVLATVSSTLTVGGTATIGSFTVATLPAAGTAGRMAYCSNGRAFNGAGAQEGAGAGTGCLVTDSGSAWRVAGTNVTVSA